MSYDNEAIVRNAYHTAEGNVQDLPGWTGSFTEDGVFNNITGEESYRGGHLKDIVITFAKMFPDVHRELHRVNVMGDVVAIELSIQGTFRGPMETPAGVIQPTGEKVNMERVEKIRVSDEALDLVFRKARTYNAWLPKPVPDELLQQLYDTLKWGPTSANISPARFVFIRSTDAKDRLRPSLAPGNVEKTMAAPVTVIIAYDLKFYDKLPRLFPQYPAMRNMFVNKPQLLQETALRNSTLQGAYMILAARALGLDCGPMSGFDNAKLDEEFFAAGQCDSCEQEFFPEGHVKSNFLCNIGYGNPATLKQRGPRLDSSEACTLL